MLDSPSHRALSLHTNLANVLHTRGEVDQARALFDEGLARARQCEDGHAIAHALRILARWHRLEEARAQAVALLSESLRLLRPLKDLRCAHHGVEDLAVMLVEDDCPTDVARLFGASDALLELIGRRLDRGQRETRDRAVAGLEQRLDPEALAVAWAEGRAMSFDQAVEFALDVVARV